MMINKTPWSKLLAGIAILLVLLGLLWLTFEAAGGTPIWGASAAPTRLDLTPDEVRERLEPADAFDTSRQDLADALVFFNISLGERLANYGTPLF